MSMAMPRSDDVRAESQAMMFVLASDMEPLGRNDKAVDKAVFWMPMFSCILHQ